MHVDREILILLASIEKFCQHFLMKLNSLESSLSGCLYYVFLFFPLLFVGKGNLLAVLQPFIIAVCTNQSKFNHPDLKAAATLALSKYMIVR